MVTVQPGRTHLTRIKKRTSLTSTLKSYLKKFQLCRFRAGITKMKMRQ
ncbi:MAG: hypothetical protein IIB00_03815 [candidate division Zixibacteria bacterium]|nr:hypothetical protein [candidate division Zixibacteria bacterium]